MSPVRRRLERSDARRISGRTWLEEEVLQTLAGQRAANTGLTGTWPKMVLRLIRCALAIRDAEGEELIAQEMLEQVRLPLKTAAAELLTQAGMLRPRTAPPPDGLAGAVLRGLCVLGHYGNPMPRLSRMAEQP